MEVYDYVVIGSGSAGGVVAGRLSEGGKYKVLCLEAGEKGANYLWTRPPAGSVFMIDDGRVNWRYHSEPHESSGGRRLYIARGKLVGGTSAINGMIYSRGLPLDYDTWAQQGCNGWSFNELLPYFKRIECTEIGLDEFRGRTGPVKVTEARKISPFYDLFIRSAQAVGLPFNHDYSGKSLEGVAMAQQTIARGMRQSTATQFVRPATRSGALTLLTGAEATSLVVEGQRCRGVRFFHQGLHKEVAVRREVIVSCGTANSPKLLELSGIGNPEFLARHGIKVVHALRGVGENLRDHFAATLKWRFGPSGISISPRGRGWRLALEVLRYVFFRRGFIAQGMGTMRVNMRSRAGLKDPDIMMSVAPFIMEVKPGGQGRRMSAIDGFFMFAHMDRPESQGSVHIRSANPFDPPEINFRFLGTSNDRQTSIDVVRRAREIVQAPPLGSAIAEEIVPGKHVQSDDEILDYLRKTGSAVSHLVGTCRMGIDEMAVVDERLRVRGITGLRVADASIMPTVISGGTSVPCMVIGEKCAEMVLQDAETFSECGDRANPDGDNR